MAVLAPSHEPSKSLRLSRTGEMPGVMGRLPPSVVFQLRIKNMKSLTVIGSRHGDADARTSALENAVVDRFRQAGWDVLVVPHLYHIAEQSGLWQELSQRATGDVVVFSWLHPRPAQW